MKSEHRHELKTNELAEWLSNFPQWAKENLKMIIYVSVIIVLALGIYFWKRYEKNVVSAQRQFKFTELIAQLPLRQRQILQDQAKGLDSSFNLLRLAENLQIVAGNAKNDLMAALALIKQADTLRMELHYRRGAISSRDLTNPINQAKASYTEAIETYLRQAYSPLLIAKAKFGLGLCEEELGNFEKAKQVYHDILANASLEGTAAAAAVKHRLDTMSNYQQKVAFRQSPKPTQTGLIQPQIKLEVPDVNLTPQTPNNAPSDASLMQNTANKAPTKSAAKRISDAGCGNRTLDTSSGKFYQRTPN
jgi:hypothetical protein